ncbi:MAG: hypothetical protein MHM6MM_006809, partial [Cercozoa sp. M6MM]
MYFLEDPRGGTLIHNVSCFAYFQDAPSTRLTESATTMAVPAMQFGVSLNSTRLPVVRFAALVEVSALHDMVALKLAVDEFNKLSTRVFDVCVDVYPLRGDINTSDIITISLAPFRDQTIVSLLGPNSNELTEGASLLSNIFNKVLFSPRANSHRLSNRKNNPFLCSASPTPTMLINATLDFIEKIGWRRVSIIATHGLGARLKADMAIAASARGFEVGSTTIIEDTRTIDSGLTLLGGSDVRVVVALIFDATLGFELLQRATEREMMGIGSDWSWIGTSMWSQLARMFEFNRDCILGKQNGTFSVVPVPDYNETDLTVRYDSFFKDAKENVTSSLKSVLGNATVSLDDDSDIDGEDALLWYHSATASFVAARHVLSENTSVPTVSLDEWRLLDDSSKQEHLRRIQEALSNGTAVLQNLKKTKLNQFHLDATCTRPYSFAMLQVNETFDKEVGWWRRDTSVVELSPSVVYSNGLHDVIPYDARLLPCESVTYNYTDKCDSSPPRRVVEFAWATNLCEVTNPSLLDAAEVGCSFIPRNSTTGRVFFVLSISMAVVSFLVAVAIAVMNTVPVYFMSSRIQQAETELKRLDLHDQSTSTDEVCETLTSDQIADADRVDVYKRFEIKAQIFAWFLNRCKQRLLTRVALSAIGACLLFLHAITVLGRANVLQCKFFLISLATGSTVLAFAACLIITDLYCRCQNDQTNVHSWLVRCSDGQRIGLFLLLAVATIGLLLLAITLPTWELLSMETTHLLSSSRVVKLPHFECYSNMEGLVVSVLG